MFLSPHTPVGLKFNTSAAVVATQDTKPMEKETHIFSAEEHLYTFILNVRIYNARLCIIKNIIDSSSTLIRIEVNFFFTGSR